MAWIQSFTILITCTHLLQLSTGGCLTEPREAVSSEMITNSSDKEPLLINTDWQITNMATAYGDLVIEVETINNVEPLMIACTLTEPLKDKYDEVLVYVRGLSDTPESPARRVRWTLEDGYVELDTEENN